MGLVVKMETKRSTIKQECRRTVVNSSLEMRGIDSEGKIFLELSVRDADTSDSSEERDRHGRGLIVQEPHLLESEDKSDTDDTDDGLPVIEGKLVEDLLEVGLHEVEENCEEIEQDHFRRALRRSICFWIAFFVFSSFVEPRRLRRPRRRVWGERIGGDGSLALWKL